MANNRGSTSLIRRLNNLFQVITDWLLILLGGLLLGVAYRAIDVVEVKYAVMVVGLVLAGAGFWFRYRRLKARRRSQP
ncbi:hypothetical protein [Desulfogranum mediterraneum]|uniref:hypothetical protein n=1 Tax=Desulfogranum mediterraneum TaxID=160661 RepID=UPI000413CA61|nr:hypothetical protein [Desulfogranum mediterraneum]